MGTRVEAALNAVAVGKRARQRGEVGCVIIYLYWTEYMGRRYGRCRLAWLVALVSALPSWFISRSALHYAIDGDACLRRLERWMRGWPIQRSMKPATRTRQKPCWRTRLPARTRRSNLRWSGWSSMKRWRQCKHDAACLSGFQELCA